MRETYGHRPLPPGSSWIATSDTGIGLRYTALATSSTRIKMSVHNTALSRLPLFTLTNSPSLSNLLGGFSLTAPRSLAKRASLAPPFLPQLVSPSLPPRPFPSPAGPQQRYPVGSEIDYHSEARRDRAWPSALAGVSGLRRLRLLELGWESC